MEYRETVASKKFKLSYSAKGCPYDNTCKESLYVMLKKECVCLNTVIDFITERESIYWKTT